MIESLEPMRTSKSSPESGAVAAVSIKDGSVTRTISGEQAGRAASDRPGSQFHFRYKLTTGEKTGYTSHSHLKGDTTNPLTGRQAGANDRLNQYPSSGDLKVLMHRANAPIFIKGPDNGIREAYRIGGVDHYVTIRPGNSELSPIPLEISDNFVVDEQ